LKPAALEIGDVAEVRGGGGAVADVNVAVRAFAGAAAIEKIFDVIDSLIAWGLDDDGRRAFFGGLKFKLAAIDEELTFSAADFDTFAADAWGECGFKGGSPLGGIFEKHVDGVGCGAAVFVLIDATGCGGSDGVVLIHKHMDDIDPVGKEVCNLTTAEFKISPEIPEALGIPIAPFHWAEKAGPIEIGGLGGETLRGSLEVSAVAVPPGAGQGDFAEFTGIEILALGLEVVLTRALLHADLTDAVVYAGGFNDVRPLFDGKGERLFNVDVFAGVESIDGATGVPMVWGGNENGVDIFGSEQFVVVCVALGGGGFLLGPVDTFPIDVADGGDIYLLSVEKGAHDTDATAAAADEAKLDTVVGTHNAGVAGSGKGCGHAEGAATGEVC